MREEEWREDIAINIPWHLLQRLETRQRHRRRRRWRLTIRRDNENGKERRGEKHKGKHQKELCTSQSRQRRLDILPQVCLSQLSTNFVHTRISIGTFSLPLYLSQHTHTHSYLSVIVCNNKQMNSSIRGEKGSNQKSQFYLFQAIRENVYAKLQATHPNKQTNNDSCAHK